MAWTISSVEPLTVTPMCRLIKAEHFQPFKVMGKWKKDEGYKQDRVCFADIDGDDRLNYCTVSDDGNIRCCRNSGLGKPYVFEGLGFSPISDVYFSGLF